MTQVGFACWGLGLITLFRPCFIFLVSLLSRISDSSYKTRLLETYALPACYFWFAVLVVVFFILGFIPVFATTIKKRSVLLIHPWALMLLYFDVVVWSVIAISLQLQLNSLSPYGRNTVDQVEYVIVCFVIIYIDILTYFIIHYVFATYYIVAELTIIEKFY